MFCSKCGKEIKDESKFCCHCGAKIVEQWSEEQAQAEKTTDEKKTDSQNKNQKKFMIIGIVSLSFLLVVVMIIGFYIKKGLDTGQRAAYEKENEENETEEAKEEEKTTDTLPKTEAAEEEKYTLLVCVPAEYMSLRSTPGLGDDVIEELEAGTYLKWYGESVTVDETEFYKVVVRDSGQEGYVSARFCVKVEYEPDESVLTLVETDSVMYTYDMMVEDIETLCNTYPDRLSYNIIGTSCDGRNIYEVILGNPNAENHIMMQAAIHGREYMTAQLAMKLLEYYSYYYESAEFDRIPYQELFNKTAIHIVPMSNPDGVTISQLGIKALNNSYYADLVYECYERDWWAFVYEEDTNGDMNWSDHYLEEGFKREDCENSREITFEEYQTIWKANAAGVDLNNNFDAGWEEIELKEAPAYGSFKGYWPVSEPESAALVELAYKYDYRCFISYHARGQLIYYDVVGNSTENAEASANFANLLDGWIKYKTVNTSKGYNVNLGGFGDWVQLSLNKPSVTIENGKTPCPLGIQEFSAIWLRHRESWAMLAQQFYN